MQDRKAADRKWSRDYYYKHQAKIRLQRNERRLGWKLAVIHAYGGKCVCCGEAQLNFLTIEHINHDGQKHRQEMSWGGYYKDIINRNFPKDYTILCMNCNWATRLGQICPHKQT